MADLGCAVPGVTDARRTVRRRPLVTTAAVTAATALVTAGAVKLMRWGRQQADESYQQPRDGEGGGADHGEESTGRGRLLGSCSAMAKSMLRTALASFVSMAVISFFQHSSDVDSFDDSLV